MRWRMGRSLHSGGKTSRMRLDSMEETEVEIIALFLTIARISVSSM